MVFHSITRQSASVFLDTSVLKHAASRLIQPRLRRVTQRWGLEEVSVDVTEFVQVDPNAKIEGPLRAETRLIALVAELGRVGLLRLITHHEVRMELWRLPKIDPPARMFYGAPIDLVGGPFPYERVIAGWARGAPVDAQFDFVKGIEHPRYAELKRAVGANPASSSYRNQLLDAFHLWCAEASEAEFFLTTDFKLIRHVAHHKSNPPKCRVVSPRELLRILLTERRVRVRDMARAVIRARRTLRHEAAVLALV